MDAQLLFGIQFTLSLVICAMIAVWYIAPWARSKPLQDALVPLFLIHAFRYLPSSGFAPGQIGADVPGDAMTQIVYGDLTSSILALIAVVFLRFRWAGAIAVAWTANIVMGLDWLYATYVAASNELVTYSLGVNWYIVSYYVPLLAVVHGLITWRLLKNQAPG